LAALQVQGDELLLYCPSDHHVPDAEAFARTVAKGVAAAEAGAIVALGVSPTHPSTGYGYIAVGEERAGAARCVTRFIEKPDLPTAQRLLLDGGVLWNAGIFLARASTMLAALKEHAPDILASCEAAVAQLATEQAPGEDPETFFARPGRRSFESCRSQSIDYAVMEKHKDLCVVPFEGQWSDVGSWAAVADLGEHDGDRNQVIGQGLAHKSANTFIHAPHRPVVALGTRDLLIIDTPDAVLVAHRDAAEEVKDVVARLQEANASQAVTHRRVARPWGWYDRIDAGERFQVKRVGVKPGASLSLQKHHHRAEHWVIVRGTAQVTRGNETFLLTENQSAYIPIGELHRLHNPGRLELELIEVQSGSYLDEDDIVRVEDTYGRVK
jgi:mannose-1-phosphate guanylyltransferase/mannose-6-phosphate isomerase